MSDEQPDPFAELDLDDPFMEFVTPTENVEVTTTTAIATPTTKSKSVFVFDLETVPDESRFPRPVRIEKQEREDYQINMSNLAASAVPAIKKVLPLLSAAQIDSLLSIERSAKKPRSGVIEAIEKQIELDNTDPFEAQMAEWRKLSFNPFGCKIVALGIEAKSHSVTLIAQDEDAERGLIATLWEHINSYRIRCGYNITAFDDMVLIARSMVLGIDGYQIARKRYGDNASIDLMTQMFPAGNPQKLKEVCRMLGIIPLAGYEMSGDKVFDLVEAGDWDGIANYVHSDAVIEFELYNRLSNYIKF